MPPSYARSLPLGHVLRRVGLTPTGLIVLALVAGGWYLARAAGSKAMFLMVYGALATVTMAWLASRRRLSLNVERSSLPARVRAGQPVDVSLTIRPRRRVSTIVIREELPERLGATVHIPVGALTPPEDLEYRYTFTPELRGVYAVGPMVATWSDPFTLTSHSQVLAPQEQIIVHPPVEAVHDRVLTRMWEDPPIRPPLSKPWPVGFEFYGMRDYVPGDDLRRVVWSVVAKTGRMMVREFEQGITDRIVLFVDTGSEWHSGGEVSETFETAIRTAASIGARHLEDGFSITLVTNDGRRSRSLRGRNALLPYLDELARLELSDTPPGLAGHLLVDEARSGAHVLFITPHLDDGSAKQLRLVIDRGSSVVVAKVIWEESDPLSLARAAALGCQIVQIAPGASLEAVFANQMGSKGRR